MVGETPPLTDENNNNLIANNNTALPEADATAHDQEWFVDDAAARLPVNGNYHFRNWAVKTRMGYMLGRGGDHQNSYSRIEYFLMLFPPEQLQLILQLTNHELGMARKTYTSAGEIVKFFGVMLLATRFEFRSRASLWSNVTTNKYIPAPSFGQTGMPRKRFDDLWMCIRFSEELRVGKCCDSHEDDGFAFHWSGQNSHKKIPNVLPVQLGVGPAGRLQGIGGQGNRRATNNAVVRMDGSGPTLFRRQCIIVRFWCSIFSEQVAPSVVGVGCTA